MRTGRIIFFIFLTLAACETAKDFPLPEENYFVKYYGSEGNQEGVDFVVNSDGSIVMLGNSETDLERLIYVVKVDENGMVLWEHKYGTFSPGSETARDIELHPDGRIVVAGETEKGTNDSDVFLFTLDNNTGLMLDSVRVGLQTVGLVETDEEVRTVSIIQNGFIVTGASTRLESGSSGANDKRDCLHLRFDNSLNWISELTGLWSDVTGTNNSDDFAVKTIEITPQQYLVFGYSNNDHGDNTTDYDYWVFSLGVTGSTEGIDSYFGSETENEILSSIEISPIESGPGIILTGIATRPTGESRSSIMKLITVPRPLAPSQVERVAANIESNPTNLGSNVGGLITTKSIANESFVMLSNNNTVGSSISLLRLRRDLTPAWSVPELFGGAYEDFAGSVAELPNGRLLVIGTMTLGNNGQRKMVLMKLNPDGKLED